MIIERNPCNQMAPGQSENDPVKDGLSHGKTSCLLLDDEKSNYAINRCHWTSTVC